MAYALLEQGEAEEATRVLDRGGFPEQLPLDQVHLVWFRLHRARVRIETGSPERGVEELLQVGETVRLVPFDNPGTAPWRSWAAEGLRLLGRNDQARVLAADELALARRWGDPQTIGAALHVLGLVEGGTAGIGLLTEAAEVLAGSQARLKHARALVELGPRSDARTGAPRHASGSGRGSTSRKGSAPSGSPGGPTTSSPPPGQAAQGPPERP